MSSQNPCCKKNCYLHIVSPSLQGKDKREFVRKHVIPLTCKTKKIGNRIKPREHYRHYYLPNEDGGDVQVCKTVFLQMLNISSDYVNQTLKDINPNKVNEVLDETEANNGFDGNNNETLDGGPIPVTVLEMSDEDVQQKTKNHWNDDEKITTNELEKENDSGEEPKQSIIVKENVEQLQSLNEAINTVLSEKEINEEDASAACLALLNLPFEHPDLIAIDISGNETVRTAPLTPAVSMENLTLEDTTDDTINKVQKELELLMLNINLIMPGKGKLIKPNEAKPKVQETNDLTHVGGQGNVKRFAMLRDDNSNLAESDENNSEGKMTTHTHLARKELSEVYKGNIVKEESETVDMFQDKDIVNKSDDGNGNVQSFEYSNIITQTGEDNEEKNEAKITEIKIRNIIDNGTNIKAKQSATTVNETEKGMLKQHNAEKEKENRSAIEKDKTKNQIERHPAEVLKNTNDLQSETLALNEDDENGKRSNQPIIVTVNVDDSRTLSGIGWLMCCRRNKSYSPT